ncbi:MAG: NAD(P)H-dependent oxidoreductase subunit E [Candidatus Cloacimonetes bacterium]|nr:NAD(P)H-dependent oxidoreductase subunit E [Candidatus Cloacimonadota bacterium]
MQLARSFNKVIEIVNEYNCDSTKVIAIMQAVQEEYRYLPEEVLTYVATMLDMSPATIYGVATFYSHFSLTPKGKNIVKICDGTACHVKGSGKLIDAVRKKLDLSAKTITTPDMLFTLETVSCLGACGLAPVILINDEVYGQVSIKQTLELIEDLIKKEASNG